MEPSEAKTDGNHPAGLDVNSQPRAPVVLPPRRERLPPSQPGLRIGAAVRPQLGKITSAGNSTSHLKVRKIGVGASPPVSPVPPQAAAPDGLVIAVPSNSPPLLIKGLRWRRLPTRVFWKIPVILMVGLLVVIVIKLLSVMAGNWFAG